MTAGNDWKGTRTYITDEVLFDVPEGFVDKSLTMLSSTKSPMSITIDRNPAEGTLQEQVAKHLENVKKVSPSTKVLGSRDREVGNLPAREVKLSTIAAGRQQLYVRQTYVSYYGTLLTISMTAQRQQQQLCDATAERLVTNLKFRKR